MSSKIGFVIQVKCLFVTFNVNNDQKHYQIDSQDLPKVFSCHHLNSSQHLWSFLIETGINTMVQNTLEYILWPKKEFSRSEVKYNNEHWHGLFHFLFRIFNKDSKQGKCTEQIALDTCFYLASEQLNDTAFDLPAECCDRSQVALVFIYKTPTHTEYTCILQSKIFLHRGNRTFRAFFQKYAYN